MAEGWIKLNRQLQEHWLWSYTPFSYGQAWIDLLMLANYEDKKIPYKNEIITCKRGDVNLSITYLADRWKWDRRTVRKFLRLLENDGMVSLVCTTHRTTITIEKYEDFQGMRTTKCTTKSQQDGQPSPITKKDKKDKNIIKAQNRFNQFEKSDYDFDELERILEKG